ncbi:KEOPS complex subunit Pcc1 [Methanococcoides sp. NM1]|uniref:KEOPS complex subunit Pcc1 n=1 Tax=Methanococcoides sp. NM1 TaxID=1201013 RepID=UPI001082392A|nr:KEOPS complex subunit Pcc1 [Methanococcoides sp. NM1]
MKLFSESVMVLDDAAAVYRSILPELETTVTDRASVDVEVRNSSLVMRVSADDIISMRSTLNTWLRLVQVAHGVCVVGKGACKGV